MTALQKVKEFTEKVDCNNRECGVPLHYSIDSKEKNPYFPCCSGKCYEALRAREKRDREEHEARWHEQRRTPEEKARLAKEKKEKEDANANFGLKFFFTFVGIVFLVLWFMGGLPAILTVAGWTLGFMIVFIIVVSFIHWINTP